MCAGSQPTGSRNGSLWKEPACQGCTEACPPPGPRAQAGKAQEVKEQPPPTTIGPLKGAPELPRVSALVKCGLSSSGRRNGAELGFFVPGAASRNALPPPPRRVPLPERCCRAAVLASPAFLASGWTGHSPPAARPSAPSPPGWRAASWQLLVWGPATCRCSHLGHLWHRGVSSFLGPSLSRL